MRTASGEKTQVRDRVLPLQEYTISGTMADIRRVAES